MCTCLWVHKKTLVVGFESFVISLSMIALGSRYYVCYTGFNSAFNLFYRVTLISFIIEMYFRVQNSLTKYAETSEIMAF
jgi:hypothetical protein